MTVKIKSHAYFEMERRNIAEKEMLETVSHPDQIVDGKGIRKIHQKKYFDNSKNKWYLLRVIVETFEDRLEVITTYKISKIDKYWEDEE